MNLYLTLYADNSTRVELRGLQAFTAVNTLAYVNDATVTVTITDSDGAEVSGQSWPLAMAYESDSNGNYSGVVDEALSVTAGDILTATITAISGLDQGTWAVPIEVLTRTHRSCQV